MIYAAHPMTTYGTPLERSAIARIEKLLPDAEVINPATRYGGKVDWYTDWPILLPRLSGLVVFGDENGSIGTGCLTELADAWWRGIPVAMLDGKDRPRELVAMTVQPNLNRNSLNALALVSGQTIELSQLAAWKKALGRSRGTNRLEGDGLE